MADSHNFIRLVYSGSWY